MGMEVLNNVLKLSLLILLTSCSGFNVKAGSKEDLVISLVIIISFGTPIFISLCKERND